MDGDGGLGREPTGSGTGKAQAPKQSSKLQRARLDQKPKKLN